MTSWIPAGGTEAIFLSEASSFAVGRPISGGIPVIFRRFGDRPPRPYHGVVRLQEWETAEDSTPPPPGVVRATLRLQDNERTRVQWPFAFEMRLTVDLDATSLCVHLSVYNRGDSPFPFHTALHTYFRVADIQDVEVDGLQGISYHDKLADTDAVQTERELSIDGPVTRIYRGVPAELRLHDRGGGRSFRITSAGFSDAVVWNPWAAKAKSDRSMREDEYREMLCVEAAEVATPVELAAGSTWSGLQRIEAE